MSEEQTPVIEEPKPIEQKMVFLTTFDGHVIYDVDYKKVWIKDNHRGEVSKSLCDINENDRYIFIGPFGKGAYERVDNSFQEFITLYKTIIVTRDPFLIKIFPQYFIGDSIYNFFINPDYLSRVNSTTRKQIIWNSYTLYDRELEEFLKDECADVKPKVCINSFNLVQQLHKMAFDAETFEFEFMINTDTDKPYWYFNKLIDTEFKKVPKRRKSQYELRDEMCGISREDLFDKVFEKDDDIEIILPLSKTHPTGYRRIKHVVKDIVDTSQRVLTDRDDDLYGQGTYTKKFFEELY